MEKEQNIMNMMKKYLKENIKKGKDGMEKNIIDMVNQNLKENI